jgi:hypothetical protein
LTHSNYQNYKVLFSLLWLIVPTDRTKAKPSCSQHDNGFVSLKLRDTALGAMMTAKRPAALSQRLQKQLYQLQASGAVVWRDVRRSNRAYYAHVAMLAFL